MAPVKVDPAKVKTFENAIAFDRWLSVHHREDELWLRIYKVDSGRAHAPRSCAADDGGRNDVSLRDRWHSCRAEARERCGQR
jgi:hypothetical protein